MRLADLRPCDRCCGPLLLPASGRAFTVVRITVAIVTEKGLDLLEAAGRAMVPIANIEARHRVPTIVVLGDQDPALMDERLFCSACQLLPPERRHEQPMRPS